MKKIVIDARMIGLQHAGIGRYIDNLISTINYPRLRRGDPSSTGRGREAEGGQLLTINNWKIYLLCKPERINRLKKRFGENFVSLSINASHYSLKEQFLLPLALLKINPDLIHFPHFNAPIFCPYPFVVTIHDLIKHQSRGKETTTRSQPIYWLKYLLYRFVFWWTVKRAKKIIAPSLAVKEELVKRYQLDPDKVVLIYLGVEEKFKITNEKLKNEIKNSKLLEKYNIKKPFLIYTGSLYPHKNINRLIQAIKLLISQYTNISISLIIVCARNVFWERIKKKIKELNAEKLVKLVGFVPDNDLIILYQEAVAFIQPSLMEGFDLPVLEAMATGLPCLVSDIPVHREIYQDVPYYFNPRDVLNISQTIKLALKHFNTTKYWSKKEAGIKLVKQFTWQKTAQKTLNTYQTILEKL